MYNDGCVTCASQLLSILTTVKEILAIWKTKFEEFYCWYLYYYLFDYRKVTCSQSRRRPNDMVPISTVRLQTTHTLFDHITIQGSSTHRSQSDYLAEWIRAPPINRYRTGVRFPGRLRVEWYSCSGWLRKTRPYLSAERGFVGWRRTRTNIQP